jgi:hypothetical protein
MIPYDPLCAWCHGPGDENGSHTICPGHIAELNKEIDDEYGDRGGMPAVLEWEEGR